jgi:hypothetical protein
MKLIISLLALLLVFPTTLAGKPKSKTIPIDWKLTGSLIHVSEGAIIEVNLKGNPGSGTGRGLSVSGPPVMWDDLPPGNACVNFSVDPGGNPTGIPSGVNTVHAQFVGTFKDGSMIWGEAAPGGYACFSGFAYASYVILGGHKRFEGATGWMDFELEVLSNFSPMLVAAEIGVGTGEIYLP